jgi:hypothetical protein
MVLRRACWVKAVSLSKVMDLRSAGSLLQKLGCLRLHARLARGENRRAAKPRELQIALNRRMGDGESAGTIGTIQYVDDDVVAHLIRVLAARADQPRRPSKTRVDLPV